MAGRPDGLIVAGVALLRADVAGAAVAVLDVVPAHELGRPGPRLVQADEALGGELGPVLGRAEQRFGIGNLVRTRDALGNEVAVAYTVRGQKSSLSDPDKGLWTYAYNAFGELIEQVSPNDRALSQKTVIQYDKLGRITQRAERSQTDEWIYDNCAMGVGKLCRTFNSAGFEQTTDYDAKGRAWKTTTTLSGPITYSSSVTFDAATGRVVTQQYPTGFTVKYDYRPGTGFLNKVSNNATGAVYWTIDGLGDYPFDPGGKLVRQQFGNGVQTWNEHDRASGRALKLRAGANTTFAVQEQAFATLVRDAASNLTHRQDARAALTETFQYDAIDQPTERHRRVDRPPQLPPRSARLAESNRAGTGVLKEVAARAAGPASVYCRFTGRARMRRLPRALSQGKRK